jgi:hypothetical protein
MDTRGAISGLLGGYILLTVVSALYFYVRLLQHGTSTGKGVDLEQKEDLMITLEWVFVTASGWILSYAVLDAVRIVHAAYKSHCAVFIAPCISGLTTLLHLGLSLLTGLLIYARLFFMFDGFKIAVSWICIVEAFLTGLIVLAITLLILVWVSSHETKQKKWTYVCLPDWALYTVFGFECVQWICWVFVWFTMSVSLSDPASKGVIAFLSVCAIVCGWGSHGIRQIVSLLPLYTNVSSTELLGKEWFTKPDHVATLLTYAGDYVRLVFYLCQLPIWLLVWVSTSFPSSLKTQSAAVFGTMAFLVGLVYIGLLIWQLVSVLKSSHKH